MHTDECDLMCCTRCKWTPLFPSMKIYSWPEVDVGVWLCTFTMQGSVHICFPSAIRLTFLRLRRGQAGKCNKGVEGGEQSLVLAWFNYYHRHQRTFPLGCLALSVQVCMHMHVFMLQRPNFVLVLENVRVQWLTTQGHWHVRWSLSDPGRPQKKVAGHSAISHLCLLCAFHREIQRGWDYHCWRKFLNLVWGISRECKYHINFGGK